MSKIIEIRDKLKINERARKLLGLSLLSKRIEIIENLNYKIYVHESNWNKKINNYFTIIITSHANNVKFFKQSIESILRQTEQNFELILIDHGCENQLKSTIDEYFKNDSRIKLLVFKENLYNPSEVNFLNERLFNLITAAVCCSEGSYFFFLSYDDYLSSNYIELMTKLFVENDNCVVASPNIASVNEFNVINQDYTSSLRKNKLADKYINGLNLATEIINGAPLFGPPGSLFCFRTDIVLLNGGLDCTNDTSQLFKYGILGDVGTNNDACLYWRHHQNQTNKLNTKFGGLYYGVYSGWLSHINLFMATKKIPITYQLKFNIYFKKFIHESTLHSIKQAINNGFYSTLLILKSILNEANFIYLLHFFYILIIKMPWIIYLSTPESFKYNYRNCKNYLKRKFQIFH
jgi:glycosyltransferase involved in cell wall biosynthesis